jgi:MraZ protein
MLFTGQFEKTLDDKRRVALPKKYRDGFGGEELKMLYLAPGMDRSLELYDEVTFSRIAEKLNQQSESQTAGRHFKRSFYSRSELVEVDKQGRFCVPDQSMEFAGLSKDIIFVGMFDHVELWDATLWKSYSLDQANQHDKNAEQIIYKN